MVTLTNRGWTAAGSARDRTALPPDPSCQPCPACGGLQCLCRPRFFAGQLLTEQDLNRLDQYITEKHKLHNRHLWGWGVVGGLEVRCAPCDGLVIVTEGYALSPCGEDIVVCKDDTVDVCALIARCRTDSEPDCRPYKGQDDCSDVIEDWILAIRYAESPSRGTTPLTGAGASCSCGGNCGGKAGCSCGGGGKSGCGCGGSGGSGCGCNVGAAQAATPAPALKTPRLNRGAPPSCEPTVTCETYLYDVYRAPEPVRDDPKGDDKRGMSGVAAQMEGEMFERIACCVKEVEAVIPAMPGDITAITDEDRQAWFNWCCRTRTVLANYLARVGGSNCEAIERLGAVVCPVPSQPLAAFVAALEEAAKAYALIVIEALVNCFCSNALPPVRAAGDPRVPLAVIKVRRRDCQVIQVCNWTPHRQHVLTFPTLEYWFGWVPVIKLVRELMHRICCDLFGMRDIFEPDRVGVKAEPVVPVAAAAAAPGAPSSTASPMMAAEAAEAAPRRIAFEDHVSVSPFDAVKLRTGLFEAVAIRGLGSSEGTSVGDIMAAVLSRPQLGIDESLNRKERAADIARAAQTPQLAMLGGMAAPLVREIAALSGRFAGRDVQKMSVAGDQAEEIAALKAAVAAQSEELAALRLRLDSGPPPARPVPPRGPVKPNR